MRCFQIFQISAGCTRFALPKDDKDDGKHILRETPSVGVTQRHEHLQRRGARAQRRAPRLHWASAPPAVGAAPHRTARTVARRNPRRAARAASHSRLAPAARATRTGVPADRARVRRAAVLPRRSRHRRVASDQILHVAQTFRNGRELSDASKMSNSVGLLALGLVRRLDAQLLIYRGVVDRSRRACDRSSSARGALRGSRSVRRGLVRHALSGVVGSVRLGCVGSGGAQRPQC